MAAIRITIILLLWWGAVHAQHTFSIVAVDPATGEVGSAGATCLSSSDCGGCGGAIIISGLAPGRGAVNAQATVCLPNSNMSFALNQLIQGASAQDALSLVPQIDPCNQGDTTNRQYGIVDFDSNMTPRVASYTGSAALSFAGHRSGQNYSAQGNILIGPAVLDSPEAGFNRVNGPLCEKLMAALMAARIPGADSRCLSLGSSSKSAFIRIARPGDPLNSPWMNLNVPGVPSGMEPIDSLYTLFQAFKAVSAAEPWAKQGIVVYPNPTHGKAQILLPPDMQEGAEISLTDLQGRTLMNQVVESGKRLVMLNLPQGLSAGTYLVTCRNEHSYSAAKIQVE